MKLQTPRDILIDGKRTVVRRSHEGRKTRVRTTFVVPFGLKEFKKRKKRRRKKIKEDLYNLIERVDLLEEMGESRW